MPAQLAHGVHVAPLGPEVIKRLEVQHSILDRVVARLEIDDIPLDRLGDEDLWQKAESTIVDLVRAARTVAMLSLDDGSNSPEALLVRDILPCPHTLDPGDAAAKAELIEVVAGKIGELPNAERRVITMYYREGLLLREIGAVLGVTESRVSQIHSRALARLQDMLREEEQ